jgi:hypothetical protein
MIFSSVAALAQQSSSSSPQSPAAQTPAPTTPAARPADVDTLEHIMAAVYDVISGPPGTRDWDRMRSLFAPGARLIPTRATQDGKIVETPLTVDDYIQRATPAFEKNGFFESAVANRVEQWDHIAHVWSTYESRHAKGEKPFARGINSFQLFNDGSRWWVVTIFWEAETPAAAIPEKYLK